MKKILLIVIIVIIFSGCGGGNKWSLFVYPYGNMAEESLKTINAFSSFEECKKGFEFNKKTFPNATFECGYKCKAQDIELGLYICDETRDD